MSKFKEIFSLVRAFEYSTVEGITKYCNEKGMEFSERTLRSMQSGLTEQPNLNALKGVGSYYGLSLDYLLAGKLAKTELYGFCNEDGVSSYLIKPVLVSLVNFLCINKPTMNKDEEWECYEERGYEPVINMSLDESIEVMGNMNIPRVDIKYMGILVGYALTKVDAEWIERELIECVDYNLSKLDKRSHKYLMCASR